MKCSDCRLLLLRYLDECMTLEENMEIETHLLSCPDCRDILADIQEEDEVLTQVITSQKLPDSFTDSLMSQIKATVTEEPPSLQKEPPKMEMASRHNRWRYQKIAVSTAAVLVLAFVTTVYIYPAFASYVSSFLTRLGGEIGVKRAAEQGLSIAVNQSISDPNYTLRVKDIIADPTRLVLRYTIEDKQGKVSKDLLINGWGQNEIYITDEAGNQLAGNPNFRRSGEYADLIFSLDNPPDKLIVHLHIQEFGQSGTAVNWQSSLPVDISESRNWTREILIKEKYATPQGLEIHLNQITYAPSATRVEVEVGYLEEGQKRIKQEAEALLGELVTDEMLRTYSKKVKFKYHIENERGEILAESGANPQSVRDLGVGQLYLRQAMQKNERSRWFGSFITADSAQSSFFVLDEITVIEPARVSIAFQPEVVNEKPVTVQYMGNTYTVVQAEKVMDEETKKPAWAIRIVSKEKVPDLNQWIVLDKQGKAYPTSIDYANTEIGDDQTIETIHVTGLEGDPELNLVLTSVTNKYTNINWRVPLPAAK